MFLNSLGRRNLASVFFKGLIDLQGTAQVARDALKLRDFSAFFIDLRLENPLIGTHWVSFNEKGMCIMPGCITQQIGTFV